MATYGGVNFGTGPTVTIDNPRAAFNQPQFGESILYTLDGGAHGRRTIIVGWVVGVAAGAPGLAIAEGTIRALNDGVARDLIDNFGVDWPNVVLDLYVPLGRVRQSPEGLYYRGFRCEFLHLS